MDLRTISHGPALRAIFFIHLVPVVLSSNIMGIPPSFIVYNLLFLISLLWSLHSPESDDAIFMASSINVLSVLFDGIIIGSYYGTTGSSFAIFMLITNLLLRPITSIILIRFYNERGRLSPLSFSGLPVFGASTSASDSRGPGVSRASYEDLDRQSNRPFKDTAPITVHRQSVPPSNPTVANYNVTLPDDN